MGILSNGAAIDYIYERMTSPQTFDICTLDNYLRPRKQMASRSLISFGPGNTLLLIIAELLHKLIFSFSSIGSFENEYGFQIKL